MYQRLRVILFTIFSLSLLLSGCKDNDSSAPVKKDVVVTSIQISPSNPIEGGNMNTLPLEGTLQYKALAFYSDGSSKDVTELAQWYSSNPSVVSIGNTGTAKGVALGESSIHAVFGDVSSNSAYLTVAAVTLTAIQVTPPNVIMAKGTKQQFSAVAIYSDGTSQNVSQSVTWHSSDTSVATIDANGMATAVMGGDVTIHAQQDGLRSEDANLTVSMATLSAVHITPASVRLAIGAKQQFNAMAIFSDGTSQNVSNSVTWHSSNPGVVTIDENGLATAVMTGQVSIYAQQGGMESSNRADLSVTAATLASVQITPPSVNMARGTKQQFTATATYSDGTTQNVSDNVTWYSSNTNVVTIDNNGLATAVMAGQVNIYAQQGSMESSNRASLTVTTATLSSVQITPPNVSLPRGSSQQFTATAVYADGTTQNVTDSVAWHSSDAGLVAIDGHGLATALMAGQVTVHAQKDAIESSNRADLTVTEATLTELRVTPPSHSMVRGSTQQFTATGVYSDGSSRDLTQSVTWYSSDASVVAVGVSGMAIGVAEGQVTVSVQKGALSSSNSASLTVTAGTLSEVRVTPASASLAKGSTQQFSATAIFSDGSVQDVTQSVAWHSSDTNVVTIDSTGLATAVMAGQVNINAQKDAMTSPLSQLTVTAATLSSLQITPLQVDLIKGDSQQFVAIAAYSDGSSQDVTRSVAWRSSDASLVTIDSNGLATGVAEGQATIDAQKDGLRSNNSVDLNVIVLRTIEIGTYNSSSELTVGSQLLLKANGLYSNGLVKDITLDLDWNGQAALATIYSGLVIAQSPGTYSVTASYAGVSSSPFSLEILPQGSYPCATPTVTTDVAGTSTTFTCAATAAEEPGYASFVELGDMGPAGMDVVRMTYDEATAYCQRKGGRLPDLDEVKALYNGNTFKIPGDLKLYRGLGWPSSQYYWTSSIGLTVPNPMYWVYSFARGFPDTRSGVTNKFYVTCVIP